MLSRQQNSFKSRLTSEAGDGTRFVIRAGTVDPVGRRCIGPARMERVGNPCGWNQPVRSSLFAGSPETRNGTSILTSRFIRTGMPLAMHTPEMIGTTDDLLVFSGL